MIKQSEKRSIRTGFGFGITSGVITTLGLMIGLNAGTGSKPAVLGGVLTIAMADAFSDALGIHIAEEAKCQQKTKDIWLATLATFLAKFIFAFSFIIPIIIFPLEKAVLISVLLGLTYLAIFSFYLGQRQNESPWPIILEHLLIAILVIFLSQFLGKLIKNYFS